MKVKKLIKQYQEKIQKQDEVISIINGMIKEAQKGETNTDLEDLGEERANAKRDRQLYFQFVKDLEDLI